MAECRIQAYDADAAEKDGVKKSFTDRLIQLRSRLTHTEFQFSRRYKEISFSFTMADNVHGARFKKIHYSHPNRWQTAAVNLTDKQEDIAFLSACVMGGFSFRVDKVKNWLFSEPLWPSLFYEPTQHWKYDLIGLLTFADDEPYAGKNSKWLAILRPILWSWTKIIQPHPKRAWCSEGCALLLQEALGHLSVSPDKLTPDGLINLLTEREKND